MTGNALEIVSQVVQAEMGPNFHTEALKAQAVAAYTVIKNYNASGRYPLFYPKPASEKVVSAVESVLGEAVYYGGDYALTTFYAVSAGVTTAAENYWGYPYSYLVSVDSYVDEAYPTFEVTVSKSARDIQEMVFDAFDIDLFLFPYEDWFTVLSYTDGPYVGNVQVGDTMMTAYQLRSNALKFLRSTAFEVYYNGNEDEFVFTTYGYGHGVGMSQVGADYYAKQGWDYIMILQHYYPGTGVS